MAQARRTAARRTKARRTSARQGGAGRGLPGWAMLTIGLIIGLFVAFLVYLDDLERPPNAAVRPDDQETAADAPAGVADDEAPDGPRFDFYSILPELEVVVPALDRSASEDARTDAADDAPAAEDNAPDDAPADATSDERKFAEGVYHLQAGSFQQADQADRMKARLTLLGLKVHIQEVRINGQQWHRVRIGPFAEPKQLRAAIARLREHDIDYLILRDRAG